MSDTKRKRIAEQKKLLISQCEDLMETICDSCNKPHVETDQEELNRQCEACLLYTRLLGIVGRAETIGSAMVFQSMAAKAEKMATKAVEDMGDD